MSDHRAPDADRRAHGAPSAPQALPSVVPGVALWWYGLDRTPDEIAAIVPWLSQSERARAARFGTEQLRHRWIAGRGTLRLVLGDALGIRPAEVPIRRGVRGRPELSVAEPRIDFNVSHTRDVALVAVARDLPVAARVGVDVERSDRDVGADRLARKFLSEREQALLAALQSDERKRRFLRYWTCKEAMSKATGDGLVAPFRRLEVEISEPPRLVAGPPPYEPARWALRHATVPAGWLATLAIWDGLMQ